MTVETVLVAQPLGTFSLAGTQPKVSAQVWLRLACSRCDFAVLGRIEGDHFVADGPAGIP